MKQNDLWWSTPANTAQDSKHKAPFPISTIRRQLCILHFRKGQQTTKVIKILLLQYISTTGTTNDWSTLTRKGTQITATGSDHHNKAQNTTDGRFPSSCKLVFVIFMTSKDNLPPCASLSKPGPQFNYRAMQVICCQTSALDHRLLNIQMDHGVTERSQSHRQLFVQHQHQVTDYSTVKRIMESHKNDIYRVTLATPMRTQSWITTHWHPTGSQVTAQLCSYRNNSP